MNGSSPPSLDRIRPLLWCLAAVPVVFPLMVFTYFHMSIVWNDAWSMADLLVRAHRGTLGFSDFFSFHNEHRIPIPLLIMFALARLTGWNTYVEMYFGFAMVCLLSGLFALLLRVTANGERGLTRIWQWFLINMLIFSPIQCENWVFGFAACTNFIPIPCIVGAMLLLYRKKLTWSTLLLCALLIEIASLSLANGLLGWAIVLPLLLQTNSVQEMRERKWSILAWVAMAVVSFICLFWGYQGHSWNSQYYSATVWSRIQFLLAFIGSPLNFGLEPWLTLSVVIGFVLTTIYGIAIVRTLQYWITGNMQWVRQALPWLAVGVYGIGGALLGSLGRAGLGLAHAATSRYTTISMCLLICLVGLMSIQTSDSRGHSRFHAWRRTVLAPMFGLILIVALAWGAVRSGEYYAGIMRISRGGMAHLSFINFVQEPRLRTAISAQDGLRERANALNESGYLRPPLIRDSNIRILMPAGADSDAARASSGAFEEARTLPEGILQLRGWAVLPSQRRPADAVLLTRDDEKGVPRLCAIGDTLTIRNDIAESLGKEYEVSGWFAEVPKARLSPGMNVIRCWAFDSERQLAYPLSGAPLEVNSD